MPTQRPDAIPVAVYFDSARDRSIAEEVLGGVAPGEVAVHDGVAEGLVDRDAAVALREKGLVVDPLATAPKQAPTELERKLEAHGPLDAEDAAVESFRLQSDYASLDGETLTVSDTKADTADGRIHDVDDLTITPSTEAALDQDVYRIRLTAPLTEE